MHECKHTKRRTKPTGQTLPRRHTGKRRRPRPLRSCAYEITRPEKYDTSTPTRRSGTTASDVSEPSRPPPDPARRPRPRDPTLDRVATAQRDAGEAGKESTGPEPAPCSSAMVRHPLNNRGFTDRRQPSTSAVPRRVSASTTERTRWVVMRRQCHTEPCLGGCAHTDPSAQPRSRVPLRRALSPMTGWAEVERLDRRRGRDYARRYDTPPAVRRVHRAASDRRPPHALTRQVPFADVSDMLDVRFDAPRLWACGPSSRRITERTG
jgi:hypothetical protein